MGYLIKGFSKVKIQDIQDRFKYIDDLSLLQLVCLSGLLMDYDFYNHVASDIGIEQQYLPPRELPHTEHTEHSGAMDTAKPDGNERGKM